MDWSKVKETERLAEKRRKAELNEKVPDETLDEADIYRLMLVLMKPGETVQGAIRRLGGSNKKDSIATKKRPGQGKIWRQRQGRAEEDSDETGQVRQKRRKIEAESKEAETPRTQSDPTKDDMLKMIGYADTIVSNGNMTIYSDTYEGLSYRVKVKDEQSQPVKAVDSGFNIFEEEPLSVTTAHKNTTAAESSTNPGKFMLGLLFISSLLLYPSGDKPRKMIKSDISLIILGQLICISYIDRNHFYD